MAAAGMRDIRAGDQIAQMVFGKQHAGDGHLAAADMRVGVDGPGHHHLAFEVVCLVGLGVGPRRYDLAVLDIEVADLARHLVRGIVDFTAHQFDQHEKLQT